MKRSLYQCAHAKVNTEGEYIYCDKGHLFTRPVANIQGRLNIRMLMKGKPLEITTCQTCLDYEEMGPPVPPGERGYFVYDKDGQLKWK